jgi:hypothetical protein
VGNVDDPMLDNFELPRLSFTNYDQSRFLILAQKESLCSFYQWGFVVLISKMTLSSLGFGMVYAQILNI